MNSDERRRAPACAVRPRTGRHSGYPPVAYAGPPPIIERNTFVLDGNRVLRLALVSSQISRICFFSYVGVCWAVIFASSPLFERLQTYQPRPASDTPEFSNFLYITKSGDVLYTFDKRVGWQMTGIG